MAHTTAPKLTLPTASGHPSETARRRTAALMRGLGSRRLSFPGGRTFVCGICTVTWSGPEADCWSCGKPPTAEYLLPRPAHSHLLRGVAPTRPHAARRSRTRKAAVR